MTKPPRDPGLDLARKYAHGGRVGYAEGGEIDPSRIARQIQERAMRGLDPTPEQAAFLEALAPEKEARSNRLGRGLPDAVSEIAAMYPGDLPTMDGRIGRQISNRAMRDHPLNYQQLQALSDAAPIKEARSEALGIPAGIVASELSGVPSVMRGGSNVMRGIEERDPYLTAGGALEAGLGLVPGASLAKPIAKAVTMPRVIGTGVASSYLTGSSDDAKAAERNTAQFIETHPEMKTLAEKRQKALADMQRAEMALVTENPAVQALEKRKAEIAAERVKMNNKHRGSGPETQKQALAPFDVALAGVDDQIRALGDRARKPFQDEIERINAAMGTTEKRLLQTYQDQASFREKYPGVPGAMYAGALGLAAGIPLAKGLMDRGADRVTRRPAIESATRDAEKAFASGLSDAETAAAQELLRRKVDKWDASHSSTGTAMKYLGGVGMGAPLAFEASNFPEQFDVITNPPGHPARERASEYMSTPGYWKERAIATIPGAGAGMLGVKGAKLAPSNTEFLDKAREVASRGEAPSLMQKAMSYLTGKSATGPTEEALDRIRRYRELAGPSGGSADAKILEAALGTAPGKAAALPAPTSRQLTADPGLPGPMSLPAPRQSRSPEAVANLENAASKASNIIKGGAPERPKVSPEGYSKTPWGFRNDETGRLSGWRPGGTPKSTKPDDKGKKLTKGEDDPAAEYFARNPEALKGQEGRWYGGPAVDPGLELARKYADGGKVVPHGLMGGDTPGRSDKLAVDVPNGAYILPADVVSALGEGSTMAGSKKFQTMSPPPVQGYAAGGSVGIMISDGEEVVHPSVVAAWGGGDLSKGHKVLDQLVKSERAKNIRKLASLPPPAQ